jgi:glycine cleavage system H protein
MSENIPDNCRYTKDHEWTRQDGDLIVIGITDHAQGQLGDVVFLELPEVGSAVQAGEPFGVVESVKAVSDLFGPLDGEVAEINEVLVETPETINEDPYEAGWMLKIRPTDAAAHEALLDAAGYKAFVEQEG